MMAQRQWRSDDTDKWLYGFGDGSDGDLVISSNTTDAPIDSSCSGTQGATTLTVTNTSFASGQVILIHQSRGAEAGNWELNKIASYTGGVITLKHPLCHTYSNSDNGANQAQILVLKQYNLVTVNSGATFTTKAWNGQTGGIIALLSKGAVNVGGIINASGTNGVTATNTTGYTTGGGFFGGLVHRSEVNLSTGEGVAGAPLINQSWNPVFVYENAGTIGAGSGCGGGNGTPGERASQTGMSHGAASLIAGNQELTKIVFGGGGGGSGGNKGQSSGTGGSGGGIIFIFSPNINVNTSGEIKLNGGAGGNGTTDDWANKPMGAGGGGAGGSLLLKCETATLGNQLIYAVGGLKGVNVNRTGGSGGVGRIHIDYSKTVSGITSPEANFRQDFSITSQSNIILKKKMLMATM